MTQRRQDDFVGSPVRGDRGMRAREIPDVRAALSAATADGAGEVVIFDRSWYNRGSRAPLPEILSRGERVASAKCCAKCWRVSNALIFFSGLGLGVRCPAPPKCSLVDFAQTAHSI